MKFSEFHIDDAEGAILAHSLRLPEKALKKGKNLSLDDIYLLKQAGYKKIFCAKLEKNDVQEDISADELATAIAGKNLLKGNSFTGRCNLFANATGLVIYEIARLNAFNSVDESITLGVIPQMQHVIKGQMIATLKIIPFSIPNALLIKAKKVLLSHEKLIKISPYVDKKVSLIQTKLPGTKESVLNSTSDVTSLRLKNLGGAVLNEKRCNHDTISIADLITNAVQNNAQLILISGASAVVDRRDVVPSAIELAGGQIKHFGMPVDPGNLMLLGDINGIDVIGIPGCARSPKLNGFDWVLQRILAGIPLAGIDIMQMGAGGLLKDILTRPLPRAAASQAKQEITKKETEKDKIHAVILAGGQSRRMGSKNKLLALINGKPMVKLIAENILNSRVQTVTVVTGFQAQTTQKALGGLTLNFVNNRDFESGLSSSLTTGVASAPENCSAIIICLGDMPKITKKHINKLIEAYDPTEGRAICVPTWQGKRGNPVLWARQFFLEMMNLTGDFGAKDLIVKYSELVIEVEMDDESVILDIDTPEAFDTLLMAPVNLDIKN
jgi:molybdenum cofactor cytidylyltransferase